MFRSLANRLTILYTAVAVGLVLVVALLYTFAGFSTVATNANLMIAQVVGQANELVSESRARGHTLAQDAPKIAQVLSQGGPRISVMDEHGRVIGGSDPNEWYRNRAILALATFLGIAPRELKVDGGFIIISPNAERISNRLGRFWQSLPLVCIIVGIIVWFAFRTITRRALHPLVEVTQALQHFGQGEFHSRLLMDAERRDELADLTASFNSAAEQVAAAFEERRKAEAQMSQFIADAGHQLRTPLTVVMGFIELLRKGTARDPETAAQIFDAMTLESRRMRALIDKLVLLARLERADQANVDRFDVASLAGSVVQSFKPGPGGDRLTLSAQPNALVSADKSDLHEAISNLVDNALKYAPLSRVDIDVATAGDRVIVKVLDQGPGMTEHEQARIFDRFYRGAGGGGVDGSGLGLAIVKHAVEQAKGKLIVMSRPGAGATFEIDLPRAS